MKKENWESFGQLVSFSQRLQATLMIIDIEEGDIRNIEVSDEEQEILTKAISIIKDIDSRSLQYWEKNNKQ